MKATYVVSDSNELRVAKIVGKGLSLGGGPGSSTRLPSVAQWDNVVDVNIAGSSPGSTIVGAEPRARDSSTAAVNLNVGTVTAKDGFTGVASAGDGDPVGELITAVTVLGALGADSKAGKERLGSRGRWDVWWSWDRSWSGQDGHSREDGEKSVLHIGCFTM
ncbi:hypothetical protein H113_02329 [Trichophyton rubrum MR1459]|uniref:Uncharacterized protein n=1 Tax=Trichophyton rubrum (strain ATCC MYA-4607 / CBS 118892) TaxID=559305 RepID=A0A080WHU2_TRIRC|nr:uncharacterized protein TERG_12365 [Trichophyton rubrum CBS 118892]EZF97753.1 hypothetical protein H113_02329 [Trichophyton rubrum MR1459]EZG08642.1 hypothetical protein H106_02192 [Trichophyton rubrum CBS 735.88]KFL62171.1 hypothetical protein TERG_12365 [Trichophyton rubrum CBS 118892]